MDPADEVRLGDVPDFRRIAELEARGEEHRTHRAIGQDDRILREHRLPRFAGDAAAGRPARLDVREGGRVERPGIQ